MGNNDIEEKFQEIDKKVKKDLEIDEGDFVNTLKEHPNIYHRYVTQLRDERRKLKKIERAVEERYSMLYDKYSGKKTKRNFKSKTGIEAVIKQDQNYQNLLEMKHEQRELCNYYDHIVDILRSRGFVLKNILDAKKLEEEALYM